MKAKGKKSKPKTRKKISTRLREEGKKPPKRKTEEWDKFVEWLSEQHGREVCGAYIRSSGWPCEETARPNGRCWRHGGKSPPPGPMHPRYQHGRYSRALKGKPIQELYEKARTDPQLLALTEDIAFLVGLQEQTLEKLREGGISWGALLLSFDSMSEAHEKGADGEFETAMKGMHELILSGMNDEDVYREYTERAEQIRKLVDTERKYQEGLRLYLPLDRANAIMGVWLDCIRRVVPQEYIALLHEEFRKARMKEMPSFGAGRDVTKMIKRGG